MRDVYHLRLYFGLMDIEYDAEGEVVAAMKLAAEAEGAEPQSGITAALAWIELARLRTTTARGHRGTEEVL